MNDFEWADDVPATSNLVIEISELDPVGIVVKEHEPIETNVPYYDGKIRMYEPMKKVRYLVKIGDYEYFLNRNGLLDLIGEHW